MASNYSNPIIQMARLNQTAPLAQYDPQQYTDPQQIAQQTFAQQAALQSQHFNQENPRLALPENFGAAIGNFLAGKVAPQSPPAQNGQGDQTAQIRAQLQQEVSKNLQAMQAAGEPMNVGKAQYMAGASMISNPAFAGNSIAMSEGSRAVSDAKASFGYTPETAEAESTLASQRRTTADEKAVTVQSAKDKLQYVAYDMAAGKDGIPSFKQYGQVLPAFGADGTLDPDLDSKKASLKAAAAAAGAQEPTIGLLSDFQNNKFLLEQKRSQDAIAAIQAKAQAKDEAQNNYDDTLAKQLGHSIAIGKLDPLSSFAGTGTSATPLKQAALKYAYAENPDLDTNQSHIIASNLKSWQTGPVYTQFSRMVTVPEHLNELNQTIDALGNGSFKPGNALYQKALQMNGGQVAAPFQLAKTLAMTEMAASLSPRGGADAEIDRLTKGFAEADNLASLHAAVKEVERFWQDKAQTAGESFETAVPGHKFVGDQMTDPTAVELLTRKYPVNIPKGKAGQLQFGRLPDTAWVTQNGSQPAQVKDLKAMMGQ